MEKPIQEIMQLISAIESKPVEMKSDLGEVVTMELDLE